MLKLMPEHSQKALAFSRIPKNSKRRFTFMEEGAKLKNARSHEISVTIPDYDIL